MLSACVGWWRWKRTLRRPTLKVSGGRGEVATEILWSNRPLPHPGRLVEPKAVGCP